MMKSKDISNDSEDNPNLQTLSANLQTPKSKGITANSNEAAASIMPLTEVATMFPLPIAGEYRLALPDEEVLVEELKRAQDAI